MIGRTPSCDTTVAWTFFEGESRRAFMSQLPVDDATWARGRGWALWKALSVLASKLRGLLTDCGLDGSNVLTSAFGCYRLELPEESWVDVIAATEADAETNETSFPGVFATMLSTGLNPAEHDFDKDGKLTLFDLYVAVAKEIAGNYASAEQVATEHAQVDDDGDGVGHELQNLYLPVEQGGTPPGKKPKARPHRDGVRAAQILLSPGR